MDVGMFEAGLIIKSRKGVVMMIGSSELLK